MKIFADLNQLVSTHLNPSQPVSIRLYVEASTAAIDQSLKSWINQSRTS
ncbi:MAG: hypothetical protein HC772_14095 [Leptolyngbyaceae cyanobacterium CRU_2_3]|nr:hypothetical protein [Leptolyngbyaceae cyanobacterium CRU_2_3]